jgi:hypothetical protein
MLDAGMLGALLDRLAPERERAGGEYDALHRKLVRFFSHRACSSPEVMADETLDRVARRLTQGEDVQDVARYAHGVAMRVFQESWRVRPTESLEALEKGGVEAEDPAAAERLDACLAECLRELPQRDSELLLRYFAGGGRVRIDDRARLAAEVGLSPNGLRIRVCRLKEALGRSLKRRLAEDEHSKRLGRPGHEEWRAAR